MRIKDYTEEQINEVFDEHKSVFYTEEDDVTAQSQATNDNDDAKKKAKKKKVVGDKTAVKSGEQPVSIIKEGFMDAEARIEGPLDAFLQENINGYGGPGPSNPYDALVVLKAINKIISREISSLESEIEEIAYEHREGSFRVT